MCSLEQKFASTYISMEIPPTTPHAPARCMPHAIQPRSYPWWRRAHQGAIAQTKQSSVDPSLWAEMKADHQELAQRLLEAVWLRLTRDSPSLLEVPLGDLRSETQDTNSGRPPPKPRETTVQKPSQDNRAFATQQGKGKEQGPKGSYLQTYLLHGLRCSSALPASPP